MDLVGCTNATTNASAFFSYLMRKEETGLICTSKIMQDPSFREGLDNLRLENHAEYVRKFGKNSQKIRERVLPEGAKYQVVQKQKEAIKRFEILQDSKIKRRVLRTPEHEKVQQILHRISQTQKFDRPSVTTCGQDFLQQLPRELLTDANAKQKIIDSVKAVRDCFPDNMPLVLTVHYGDEEENPHIQGWLSPRVWDSEKSTWGSRHDSVNTKEGLRSLRESVHKAVEATTGYAVDTLKNADPDRPRRTAMKKTTMPNWNKHNKIVLKDTSRLIQGMSHEDFMKAEFLKDVKDPAVRRDCLELIAQVNYDRNKVTTEQQKRVQNHRAYSAGLEFNEMVGDMHSTYSKLSATAPPLQVLTAEEVAINTAYKDQVKELEDALAEAESRQSLKFRYGKSL